MADDDIRDDTTNLDEDMGDRELQDSEGQQEDMPESE
jgi:hypothetical protein